MNKKSVFWGKHWEKQSKLENEINVSGWGSKQIKEYLYDLDDVSKKLALDARDKLLNIGCGNGLMEIVLNYWIAKIDSVDFSAGMIKRAGINNASNDNVRFYVGNILDLRFLNSNYDKVLCNSVLQYLNDLSEVSFAINQIATVCENKSKILISANPDKSKLEDFLSGYDKLDLSKEEKEKKKDANKLALWTDPEDVAKIGRESGFKVEILKMNPNVWQSFYMYDLLLWRE